MYCPTCGSEIEEMIEHNGARVCPECGCVVEMVKNSTEKKPKKLNKLKTATVFAVIGTVLGVVYLAIDILDYFRFHSHISISYVSSIVSYVAFMALAILMIVANKKKNIKKAFKIITGVLLLICASRNVWRLIDLIDFIVPAFESGRKYTWISAITSTISCITIICFFVFMAMFTFLRKKVYGVVLIIAEVLYLISGLVRLGIFSAFGISLHNSLHNLLILLLNISLAFSMYMSVLYGIENEKEVETDVGKKNMV